MSVDPVQIRVLGCLLEKQRTTPDQYPLSLNALRLACNQTTNRDPVVDFDERIIHGRAAGARPPGLDESRERCRQSRGQVPTALHGDARSR